MLYVMMAADLNVRGNGGATGRDYVHRVVVVGRVVTGRVVIGQPEK